VVLFALLGLAFAAQLVIPSGRKVQLVADSYIVVFKNSSVATQMRDRHLVFLADNKISPKYMYDMDGFVGYNAEISNKTVLEMVLKDSNVDYVEHDQMMHLVQEQVQDNAPWHLERVCRRDIADMDGTYRYRISGGAGVIVYVIDTGTRCTHRDFATSRCTFPYDATGEGLFDGNGHGTHVASISAGVTYGVAKRATIIAVKVLTSGGSGTNAGVIAGVNYVTNQYKANKKPSLANMSLGGPKSAALDQSVAASIVAGVSYAIAAGNSNMDACMFSPAGVTTAVTVCSTELDDMGDVQGDSRSPFSNWGTCVDICAPGSAITAAWKDSDTAIRTISGTSMASPVVCGVMALVLSDNPSLTPAQLHALIPGEATANVINMGCTSAGCNLTPNLFVYSGTTAEEL